MIDPFNYFKRANVLLHNLIYNLYVSGNLIVFIQTEQCEVTKPQKYRRIYAIIVKLYIYRSKITSVLSSVSYDYSTLISNLIMSSK